MIGIGGDLREAVPLWASIPVALLLLVAWAGLAVLAWRALVPRSEGEVLASGQWADALGAGACFLVAALVALVPLWMVGTVAVGYATARLDALSWGETVGWTAVGGTVLVAISGSLAATGAAAWRGSRGARTLGLVLLGLVLLAATNAS